MTKPTCTHLGLTSGLALLVMSCTPPTGAGTDGVDADVEIVDDGRYPDEADERAACDEDNAALLAETGAVRPQTWVARSHCKRFDGMVDEVFIHDGDIPVLALTITATDYAAMRDELAALSEGTNLPGGPGGPGAPGGDECAALNVDDPCTLTGVGEEDAVCVAAFGQLLCVPLSFLPTAEEITACNGANDGDACDEVAGGTCQQHPLRGLACASENGFGLPGGGGGRVGGAFAGPTIDPCAGKADNSACTQGQHDGQCSLLNDGALMCAVRGLDRTNAAPIQTDLGEDPSYYRATVSYRGAAYTDVGIRYKGNSSLFLFAEGEKLPFRLKFDEFEDSTPAIRDQRMFGFQHLSFTPNRSDPSQLHQVLAAHVFRSQGVPAPLSSFVEVTLDSGNGPVSMGLYAMTEVPDQPLLKRSFNNDDGTLYKPDGAGATLEEYVAESFVKKTNEDSNDDAVIALIAAIHSSEPNAEAHRALVRSTFDVDGYLTALAVNQAIGNWDTYGAIPHNYYLYVDDTGVSHFIPWDFDLSFDGTGATDLALTSFSGQWPLLQMVARDPAFFAAYRDILRSLVSTQFEGSAIADEVQRQHARIIAVTDREGTTDDAVTGLQSLLSHLNNQALHINDFLINFGRPGDGNDGNEGEGEGEGEGQGDMLLCIPANLPPGGTPGGMVPPEVAAACAELMMGDACSFTIQGMTIAGTCNIPPMP
jgi:spore coat protein H